jgi:hypothetical protein
VTVESRCKRIGIDNVLLVGRLLDMRKQLQTDFRCRLRSLSFGRKVILSKEIFIRLVPAASDEAKRRKMIK